MREHKYRVWIKDKKHMVEVSMLHWSENLPLSTDLVLTSIAIRRPDGSGWITEHFRPFQVELMEYTGLRNKAGEEIFEGDVVLLDAMNVTLNKWEVYWNDGLWALRNREYEYNAIEWEECEIIGNIHENPELLR